jgi:hypothetical protein
VKAESADLLSNTAGRDDLSTAQVGGQTNSLHGFRFIAWLPDRKRPTIACPWTQRMTSECATILRLLEAKHAACDVDRVARTPASRYAVCLAAEKLRAAQVAMRDDFGAQHGWVYTERDFTLDQLRRGSTQRRRDDDYAFLRPPMDHVEYFRFVKRPWRPAAILSHDYEPFESGKALALARDYGLTATLLPNSWYWPGRAIAVLYTGRSSLCL